MIPVLLNASLSPCTQASTFVWNGNDTSKPLQIIILLKKISAINSINEMKTKKAINNTLKKRKMYVYNILMDLLRVRNACALLLYRNKYSPT